MFGMALNVADAQICQLGEIGEEASWIRSFEKGLGSAKFCYFHLFFVVIEYIKKY